jgi:transcriptional regulator with XRE-family HTH domain
MAKKWTSLYGNIPAERRARIEEQVAKDLAEMPLAEVRRARELTQQQIARGLQVNQAWVSKLERQTDMYVSTLRSYVEAMGGQLEIVARFEDGAVRLKQFDELDREITEWVQATKDRLEDSAPNAVLLPHVSIWNPPPTNARIWQWGDRSITPGSQTPGGNTTAPDDEAVAA